MRLLLGLFFLLTYDAYAESVLIPSGSYRTPFMKNTDKAEAIKSFRLDTTPVTNAQYYAFVENTPHWQPKNLSELFAEANYLKTWIEIDNTPHPIQESLQAPVTYVSWFAAQAYCRAQHGRLPTTAEWEFAAQANQTNSKDYQQHILTWYEKPTPSLLANVAQNPANAFGVFDMHGLIWEWTQDFNASMTSGESRGDAAVDNQFFCGGGSARSADPNDYATFMRFAMRSSLSARYTLANLGFRCAYDISQEPTP